MADIALRVYLEEIDGMIDGNRADEAIAHLKHILGIYPKNLEAYRLLAKALLEKNRHLDAADVFQRVLSSVPDDFISHIGMAVVREDEGNIDAAIWHMERAYEVQPSNGPVQEELRRLYGKRDGGEPPRLRLSRAALARMYEKGDLYPQAVAELRAALAEDPDRLDLKVMLATALWRAKQRAEAAEASANVIEVLPYCREANRILAHVWGETGRRNEAQGYRRRLEALDPYEAYADPSQNGDGVLSVPPESVRIPRLETPYSEAGFGPADASRPDWMEALGIEYEQPPTTAAAAESPDWLNNLDVAADATLPAGPTMPETEGGDWLSALRGDTGAKQSAPAAADVPDWLQPGEQPAQVESGDWMAGLGEKAATPEAGTTGGEDWLAGMMGETGAQQPTAQQPSSAAVEAEPGDIPDWMREDTSASRPASPQETTQPAAGSMTAFLAAMEETPAPPATSGESDVPDWLATTETAPGTGEAPAGEVPAWLQAGISEPGAPIEERANEIPAWLKASGLEPAPAQPASTPEHAEIPGWLAGSALAAAEVEPTSPAAASNELPDWLSTGAPAETAATTPASGLPDWLRSSEESPPAAAPAAPASSDLPDWLNAPEAPAPTAPAASTPELPGWLAVSEESPAPTPSADTRAPEWLQAGAPAEPESATSVSSAEDIPDWLKSNEPSSPAPTRKTGVTDWLTKAATPPKAAGAEGEIPDWLRPAEPTTTEAPAKTGVTDWLEKSVPAAAAPAEAESALEDVPDWLKPGAPVESAPDEVPEWLKPTEGEPPLTPEAKAEVMAHAAEEIPEWMAAAGWVPRDPAIPLDQAGGVVEEEETAEPIAPAEMPEWLQTLKPPEEPHPAPKASGEAPDWLRKAMEGKPDAEPKAAAPAQPRPAAAPPAAARPAPADMPADEALAWLEELARKQGAKEEELVTKQPSEVPDWLRKPSAEEEPAGAEPAVEPAASLPDWLRAPAEAETPPPTAPDWLRPPAEVEPLPAAPESPAAPTMPPASDDDALAWLEALAVKQGAKPEELVTRPEARVEAAPAWVREAQAAPPEPAPVTELPPEPIAEAEKPEWLKQVEAEADQYEAVAKGQPAPAEPAATAPESPDEALAWLEALAAKQGAKPEELVTKPEARAEEAPSWVREAQAAPAPSEPEPVIAEPEPAIFATEKPDWLKWVEAEADQYEAVAKGQPAPVESAALPEEEKLPAWLAAEPEPAGIEVPEWILAAEAAEPKHVPPEPEPLPAWLAAAPEPEPAQPDVPAWIPEAVAVPLPPASEAAPRPAKRAPEPKQPRPARLKAPRKRPAKLRSTEPPEIVLALARQKMAESNFGEAVEVYGEMIHAGDVLEDIIADLEAANQKHPDMPELLRTLGDAYMRSNQLKRALDTYKLALQQL